MAKKYVLIIALCIGLIGITGTDINAYPTRLVGWSWTPGSIAQDLYMKACANPDNRPTFVSVTVDMKDVIITFANPGGNTGGIGVPFSLDVAISQDQTVLPPVSGRGNCEAFTTFDDQWLIDAIPKEIIDEYRPNPGWQPVSIIVLLFDGTVELYNDISEACEEDSDLQATNSCYDTCQDSDDPDCINEWPEETTHIFFPNVTYNFPDETSAEPYYTWDDEIIWEWDKKDPVYEHNEE